MSDYRDERASVKASVDRLERELGEARERLAGLPEEKEEEKKTDTPAESAPKSTSFTKGEWLGCVGVALVIIGAIVGVTLLIKACVHEYKSSNEREDRQKADAEKRKAHEASMTRRVTAIWPAKVVRAEGVYIPTDTPCALRFSARGNGTEIENEKMSVQCGELSWERGTVFMQNGERSNETTCRLLERAKEPGAWEYEGRCRVGESFSPGGGRSSMSLYPEIDADTAAGRVRVRITHGTPSFLELAVEPSSASVTGEPLLDRH